MRTLNFTERPITLIFSTRDRASAFRKTLKPDEGRGKVSIRKTKGWNTYSLVFRPHAYSDTLAIMGLYNPEKSTYTFIARDVAGE